LLNPDTKSVAVVLGTRPEIIKLAPLLHRLGEAAFIVHTGQHYDDLLSAAFFDGLDIDSPDVRLAIGGKSRAEQVATALKALAETLEEHCPAAVVAQGDTNTVLAAALAANSVGVPFVHLEAGLRSFDRQMPEEHNRVVADHLSDLLLAPTETNRANLKREGIDAPSIVVTGNTIVQAVRAMLPLPIDRGSILDRYDLEPSGYVLSTLHRPENVDDPSTLRIILEELASLPVPVVLPMHPRTLQRSKDFGLGSVLADIRVLEPIGYREFLTLGAESALVISDSGGVQEEVSVYKRPLIVVRRSTERPEVIGTFAERVLPGPAIGELAHRWLRDLPAIHERLAGVPTPYGDGTAAERSMAAIIDLLNE